MPTLAWAFGQQRPAWGEMRSCTSRELMLYFALDCMGPSVTMTCLAQVIFYYKGLEFTYITLAPDSSNLGLQNLEPARWIVRQSNEHPWRHRTG